MQYLPNETHFSNGNPSGAVVTFEDSPIVYYYYLYDKGSVFIGISHRILLTIIYSLFTITLNVLIIITVRSGGPVAAVFISFFVGGTKIGTCEKTVRNFSRNRYT